MYSTSSAPHSISNGSDFGARTPHRHRGTGLDTSTTREPTVDSWRVGSAVASKQSTARGANPAKKEPPARKKKTAPACCTVPLAVLFVVACVLIAIVFASITTLSSVTFNAQVDSGIKNSLGVSLENGMKYITDPLRQSASFLRKLRAMIESSPHKYACDDGAAGSFPGNASNAGFFYEAGMYGLQRPTLQYIYQTRLSSRFSNADGSRAPIVCLVAPRLNQTEYFVNNTQLSGTYESGADLEALTSVGVTNATPSYADIADLSIVKDPIGTVGMRWLSAVMTARDLVGTSVQTDEVPTKFSYLLQIKAAAASDAQWAIGIDHNMNTLKNTLYRSTPPIKLGAAAQSSTSALYQVPGAHTTLYNVDSGILMSSTHPQMPLAQDSGEMFRAGLSPVGSVNEAYHEALRKCAVEDCSSSIITVGDEHIHTAYRVQYPDSDLHLMLVQSVPRDYFFADADRTFATTLGLSVGSCVLVVAGCVALLVLIQRPLSSLKENMMQAAELHNDRVEHTSTYLRDIAHLSTVFDGMNQQLLIARSFVPEAVLLGKTEDSQEDADDEGSVTGTHQGSEQTRVSRASQRVEPDSTIGGATNTSSNSSNGMAKLFNVAEKRVGVLSLNLVGFHGLCAPERHLTRAHKIHELSTALLTMAVGCAHRERGVMDSFHGDHFVLTFNASRAVAGPLAAAVRTANAFIGEVQESGQFDGCGGVGAGAASGRAHVGTFGIDGYRRMSVVGEAYRAANALQQAAVQFLRMNASVLREGCLVEEAALKELGSCAFHLQVVGCMQSSAHRAAGGKAAATAYYAHPADQDEKTKEAMQADGEWLYELDAMAASDPYVEANKAMTALMCGDVGLCSTLMDAHCGHVLTASGREASSASRSLTHMVDVLPPRMHGRNSLATEDGLEGGGPSPAWAYVRRQHHVYTAESAMAAASGDLASNTACFRLPWVVFQQ